MILTLKIISTITHSHCEYYTEEQFKRNVKMDGVISIIHFNSRSLNSNFSKIKHCLSHMDKKFTAIAISETWLSEEQTDMVKIEGYDMFFYQQDSNKGWESCFIH